MQEETGKLKKIIEKGSEIGGGITGATIRLIIAGPIGAIGGAIAGPLIAEVFNKVGKEISERYLGNREEVRGGWTRRIKYPVSAGSNWFFINLGDV